MTSIAIVGGGIIGLACAWRLARAGHRVALYDAAPEAREASWAAAGMLAPHHEATAADALWRLGTASLARWAEFAAALGGADALDLHLAGGLLPLIDGSHGAEIAEKRAFLSAQGVPCADLDRTELVRREPRLSGCAGALLLPGGHVDPRRVTARLRDACAGLGVDLRYGEALTALPEADEVVLAAGAWTPQLATLAGFPLAGEPVKGQLLRLAPPAGGERALTAFVHCQRAYLVPRADGSVVVGSTMVWSGFDRSEDAAAIERLATHARRLLPAFARIPIAETWTGLRPRLRSGLPLLARIRPGLVVATGHFRNGVLLTPITAEAVAELIDGTPCGVDLTPFATP